VAGPLVIEGGGEEGGHAQMGQRRAAADVIGRRWKRCVAATHGGDGAGLMLVMAECLGAEPERRRPVISEGTKRRPCGLDLV
jgi:hypothetical protein